MATWFALLTFITLASFGVNIKFSSDQNQVDYDVESLFGTFDTALTRPNLTCAECKMLVQLALKVIGPTVEKPIAERAANACIAISKTGMLPNLDDTVCRGVVQVYENEILSIVENMVDPETICSIIKKGCPRGQSRSNSKWNVTISGTKPVAPYQPIILNETYRVLHISDIHFDSLYAEGNEVDCGQPLCCRTPAINGTTKRFAGKYGTKANCDIPTQTVDAILAHIASTHTIDYIIFTGDIPKHDFWNQTKEGQIEAITTFFKALNYYFPKTPIYPTAGNNDAFPVNSFPPEEDGILAPQGDGVLYSTFGTAWRSGGNSFIPSDNILSGGRVYIGKMAAYEVDVTDKTSTTKNTKLRIISINTNYGNPMNLWLYLNDTDHKDMLKWLVGRLENAEKAGVKVQLIAHLQPSDCLPNFRRNLENILNRFEHTIVGQFYGHSHADSFKVYYDGDYSKPVGVALVPGSLTTFKNKNPTYRVYQIDGHHDTSTYKIIDYDNYYMDIDRSNAENTSFILHEYSAKKAYGLKSLDPADWSNLILAMATNDSLFQQFYSYNLANVSRPHCDDRCRLKELCKLRNDNNKLGCLDLQDIIFPIEPHVPYTGPTRRTPLHGGANMNSQLSLLSAVITVAAAMVLSSS